MDNKSLIDDIIKEKANSEKIVLPKELEDKINGTIANLPERRQVKGSRVKKTIIAAAITLVTITGLGIAFTTYARNIPVVDSVFKFLSEKNMNDKDYIDYTSDLNLSKTYNDVTVTINSIVYDSIELSIGYTVENKNGFDGEAHILDKEFKIDGERISFGSNGVGKIVNKTTYVGVDNFHVSKDYIPKEARKHIVGGDVKVPETFLMDLNIKEFSGGIKGKWNFKFKVSADKVKGKVKDQKLSIDLSKIDTDLKVNEAVFTPVTTVLRTLEKDTGSDKRNGFFIFDDKGRYLESKGASGHGSLLGDKRIYGEYRFKNIYEDTKSITVIPYRTGEYKYKEVPLNLNENTVLPEGKLGDYKITKIEFLKDKTLVHYECTDFLLQERGNLCIVDESGKEYDIERGNEKVEGKNKFANEIGALDKEKKYKLKAVDLEELYHVRWDLKFTIDVK